MSPHRTGFSYDNRTPKGRCSKGHWPSHRSLNHMSCRDCRRRGSHSRCCDHRPHSLDCRGFGHICRSLKRVFGHRSLLTMSYHTCWPVRRNNQLIVSNSALPRGFLIVPDSALPRDFLNVPDFSLPRGFRSVNTKSHRMKS